MIRRTSAVCLIATLMVACSDDEPSSIAEPPTYTIHVELDGAILVEPAGLAGEHPQGAEIEYSFTPLPGYDEPTVVVQGELAPASGKLVVDQDMVIFASADRLPLALPSDDPVLSAAESMLTSTDPEESFQELLDAIAALERQVGEDSARAHVERVDEEVFDWARNGDAMIRASEEMHGRVFRVPGGAQLQPAISARQFSETIGGSGAGAPVRTVYIHTNGMLTNLATAARAAVLSAEVAREHGLAVADLGEGAAPGGGTPRLTYLLNYNHTLGLFGKSENHCDAKLAAEMDRRDVAYMATLLASARSEVERRLGCSFRGDVAETIQQFINALLDFPIPPAGDALRLAGLANEWREAGHNVVLAGHSQGNLMAIEALQHIRPLGPGKPNCVSFVAVAPPVLTRTGPADVADGIIVGHGNAVDFVTWLPGAKPHPSSSRYARDLSTAISLVTLLSIPHIETVAKVWAGIKLHSFTNSYMRPGQEAREWFGKTAVSHYSHHATRCSGSVTGRVIDGLTRKPIRNAELRQNTPLDAPVAAKSDAGGIFTLAEVESRPQDFRVSASGYNHAVISDVEPARFETLTLPEIALVKTSATDGGLAGTVIDAREQKPLAGVAVQLRKGIGEGALPPFLSATTDLDGEFTFEDVPAGTYTLAGRLDGYVPVTLDGLPIANSMQERTIEMVPISEGIQITLSWSGKPADLDAHLTGPNLDGSRFHVYWEEPGDLEGEPFAQLDRDVQDGSGTETITIPSPRSGRYRYSVHDYTTFDDATSTALSESGARVRVFRDGVLQDEFAAPIGEGVVWTVFEMERGVIRGIGRLAGRPDFSMPVAASTAKHRPR